MFVIRRRLPTGCNPSGEGANLTISAIAIVLASRRGCLRELFRALAAQEDDRSPPRTLDHSVGHARRGECGCEVVEWVGETGGGGRVIGTGRGAISMRHFGCKLPQRGTPRFSWRSRL